MAFSKVELASQALILLRANPISSFDEGSNEADIVKTLYPAFIDDVFSRYPWRFALKKRQFNRSSTAPDAGYKYAYIIPPEAVWVFAVYNTSKVGARPVQDYDVVGNEIHSNQEEVWGEYTVYKAESNWPSHFKAFAKKALKALLAMPVTDDTELAAQAQVEAYGNPSENEKGGAFGIAAGLDARQNPPEEMPMDELVGARFS